MVCEYEGEPIAVSICSAIGDTGIYLLGASGDKGMNLNGSNLLQWQMIEWLKEQGCHWYDLGGINPKMMVYTDLNVVSLGKSVKTKNT